MQEFLAIIATFVLGLSITAVVGAGLEHRQRAASLVDEDADVRPGILRVTAAGYAVPPPSTPVELGFLAARRPSDI